jgi:acyl-CoA thioester hydrolase
MTNEFIWPIRVYYEDTDAGGVVYYANYLKFFERARSEWLNHLKIDQAYLLNEGVAFVVRKAEIDFFSPARLNEKLEVISTIKDLRGVSLIFEQQLFKQGERQQVLCQAQIKVACLQLESFTPCRIPATVREELQRVS